MSEATLLRVRRGRATHRVRHVHQRLGKVLGLRGRATLLDKLEPRNGALQSAGALPNVLFIGEARELSPVRDR